MHDSHSLPSGVLPSDVELTDEHFPRPRKTRSVPPWTARPLGVQGDGSVRRVVRHGDRWSIFRNPVTRLWVAAPADGRIYLDQGLTLRYMPFKAWDAALVWVCAELRKLDGR
jgi:hypothetical protein